MLRRLAAGLLAFLLVTALASSAAYAQSDESGTDADAQTDGGGASSSQAKAWVLVDLDSGAVLAALNHHEPHFVASLVKIMTAFVTLEQLQISNEVQVSPLAAAQPAMRIGLEEGQVWELENLLHSLLMVSANDAAYALAEAAGGDLAGFARLMESTADRLGMSDSTWLDPAGFDGEEGFQGGTQASAYDLAIMGRNALEVPEISSIVKKDIYEFHGGDDEDHRLVNHNKMLETFPGATGLKTGYTRAAGHTLMASAERDGRRLLAVVIGSVQQYEVAAALLNQGFNTPPGTEGTGEVLPETSFARAEIPTPPEEETVDEAGSTGGMWSALQRPVIFLLFVLVIAFFVRREQIKARKRRRRAMRRAYLDAKRRGMIDVIDAERAFGPNRPSGHVHVVRPGTSQEDDRWPPREWNGHDVTVDSERQVPTRN